MFKAKLSCYDTGEVIRQIGKCMHSAKYTFEKLTTLSLVLALTVGACNLYGSSDAAIKRYKRAVKKAPVTSVVKKTPQIITAAGEAPPQNTASQNDNTWKAVPYQEMPEQPKNLLFILDVSKSMDEHLKGSGENKLEMAKRVINDTLKTVPPDVKVGLRVYGHKYNANAYGAFGLMSQQNDPNCTASELLVPMSTNNHAQIMNRLTPLEPTGMTPISYSVEQAASTDFYGAQGKKIVVLVSDGRETCSKFDPCDVAVGLVRKGINIKFNVIGFDLNDSVAEDQLRCLALSTKGKFISADDEDQLIKGMRASTEYTKDVKARILPTP